MENTLSEQLLQQRGFEHCEKDNFDFWCKGPVEIQQHNDGFCIPGTEHELENLAQLEAYYFQKTGENL